MEKILYALLLAVASATAFSGLRQADFVWDDRRTLGLVDVADQPQEADAQSALKEAWRIKAGEAYQPLTKTVWTGLRTIAPQKGMSPRTLHWLSFGLHIASSILVMLVLSLVLQSSGAALVGAMLFALHPIQVEPVAYIAATKYVLATFFALIALWQYLVYCEHRSHQTRSSGRRHVQVGSVAFILGLLTTPVVAVMPIIALILRSIVPKRSSLMASRMPTWPLVLWIVFAIPPVVWALGVNHSQGLGGSVALWFRPFVAGDAFMFYIAKLIAPVLMGPDYGRSPSYLQAHWWGYITWLIPLVLFAVMTYGYGKLRGIYAAAFGVFAAALLPYLGLVVFPEQGTSTVANSFAYFAMLGPSLALAGTVAMSRRSWLPALFVLLIAACGYLTFINVRYWQNDDSLWQHAVQVNPNSPIVHATMANTFRREGNWEKAREHYQQVLAVTQVDPEIYFYLGEIEQQHGTPEKAAELFEKTLSLDPNFKEAHSRLGLAYYNQSAYNKALPHLQKAADLEPDDPKNLRYLGMLYVRREQYVEGITFLMKALRLAGDGNPTEQAHSHALIGLAMMRTQQPQAAQSHLETAVKLDPNHPDANRILGDIYFDQDLYAQARPHYETAIKSNPSDPQLFRNLGTILVHAKEYDKALTYFDRALQIKPDWPEVLTAQGTVYFQQKRFKDANEVLRKSLSLKAAQADPHYVLGDIARWQGKEAEAMAEYYNALRIKPDHLDAHYRLGLWFLKQQRNGEAIRHFKVALRSDPDDSRVVFALRKAERASGQISADRNF